jgi:hypothetical protein
MPTWDVNESFGTRRDGNILRVGRSTDGRRSIWFHPDWRRRQAVVYQNAMNLCDGTRPFMLPQWEDDQVVIEYFMFRTQGRCNSAQWSELISMAIECDQYNDHHGLGTRMKAFAIAGWTIEQIADKLEIDSEVVDVFLGIFFDIQTIIDNKERLASIVFPFAPELRQKLSPSEQRENLWIAAAFSGDPDLLEFFTQNKFQMNKEQMEQNMEVIISMLTAQAMEYGVYIRSEGLPRPAHFENFMGMQEVFAKHIGAKAAQESLNHFAKQTEVYDKWAQLLVGIGIRRVRGREVEPGGLVTNLSISELRRGNALPGGETRREDLLRRIVDVGTGVGVQSFDEAE